MRPLRATFVIVLLALSFSTLTQNQSKTDHRVVSIERLFTSYVNITDFNITPKFDAISYDNSTRTLQFDGETFTYPAEILQISWGRSEEDKWFFTASEPLPDTATATHRRRSWLWFFELTSRTFTRFSNQCIDDGDESSFTALDYEFTWTYVTDPATNLTRICEIATGERVDLPSQDLDWAVPRTDNPNSLPVFNSPDGQWLILFGRDDAGTQVFSYNTTTSTFRILGSLECRECFDRHAVNWYGHIIIMINWSFGEDTHQLFSAIVNEVDSLSFWAERPRYRPNFLNNPPRYDFINFSTPENFWETQCERISYDIRSETLSTTDMGPLCRLEWGMLDGIGYYRDVTRGDEGIALLTAFDSNTGQSRVLFEGEVESIEWVSPDERHAILVIDSDGRIDTPPFRSPLFNWGQPIDPMLAYVDLTTDTILFQDRTGWHTCNEPLGGPDWNWNAGISETSVRDCATTGPTGKIFPREDGTLLVVGDLESETMFSFSDQFADVITITDDGFTRERITQGSLTPFTQDHIVQSHWDSEQRTVTYNIVSVQDGSTFPITQPIPVDEYQAMWLTDVYIKDNAMRFLFRPENPVDGKYFTARITVELLLP